MPTTIPMPVTEKILIESSKETKFRITKASFGDGYSQRAEDGLNARIDTWDVKWGALTQAEMTLVETALNAASGTAILLWTPCYETSQKMFINKDASYQRTRIGGVFNISVTLEEVFDAIIP